MDRRFFLKTSGLLASGAASSMWPYRAARAAMAASPQIPKFVEPLRRAGGAQLPFAVKAASPGIGGADFYAFTMREFTDQVLPQQGGFPATRLWGYTQEGQPGRHLGGMIVARRNQPIHARFTNQLPATHLLPVDRTVMGSAAPPDNRTAVHLHGGKVPWISDGGPTAWFTAGSLAAEDHGVQQGAFGAFAGPAGSADYYYPNDQPARMMWYHDHALGITRLNAYAGLASGYILTDEGEAELSARHGLPGPDDPRTHYLVFQDKSFTADGQLAYPETYDTDMFPRDPQVQTPLPVPSSVPEVFGDTLLVNGTSYPFLVLPQGAHRLRMLNACSGRFLAPRLFYATANSGNGKLTEANLNAPGPGFLQIGTEGGFLPSPVAVNGASPLRLLLAPAERADLLLDLSAVPQGSVLILHNDAPAPYPMGMASSDHGAGTGFGPDTRTMLQIVVGPPQGAAPMPRLPQDLRRYNDPLLVPPRAGATAVKPGTRVRQVSLNEGFDSYGRLLPVLGTMGPNGGVLQAFEDPATEVVRQGTTEVWEIFNLTADTHPIHFHLVNVQILNRETLDLPPVARGRLPRFRPNPPGLALRPIPPDPNEAGWKETVRANPGEVTRVLMRFDALTASLPFTVPSVGVDADASAGGAVSGYKYVWHCHILEHEDRDMMRPLIVVP